MEGESTAGLTEETLSQPDEESGDLTLEEYLM